MCEWQSMNVLPEFKSESLYSDLKTTDIVLVKTNKGLPVMGCFTFWLDCPVEFVTLNGDNILMEYLSGWLKIPD